jgi:hypothetical protein
VICDLSGFFCGSENRLTGQIARSYYRFTRVEITAKLIGLIGPLARAEISGKLNRTIPLRLQSSAAECNAHGFRAIPILPGKQLTSQRQSSR